MTSALEPGLPEMCFVSPIVLVLCSAFPQGKRGRHVKAQRDQFESQRAESLEPRRSLPALHRDGKTIALCQAPIFAQTRKAANGGRRTCCILGIPTFTTASPEPITRASKDIS